MNLYNATPFAVGYTTGLQKSGRNCLVMVAKATYTLPANKTESIDLAEAQVPPYETDAYSAEPGFSAPLYENDYATHKPQCDVILLGSAYAPKQPMNPSANQSNDTPTPVTSVDVGIAVGDLQKRFRVIGPRVWQAKKGALTTDWVISEPEPFTQQTISYDTAYGGSDPIPKADESDETEEQTYTSCMENPVGVGFYPNQQDQREGLPLPLTEAIDAPIAQVEGDYTTQSFGPVARNWSPRSKLGGSYDEHWEENTKPFLPDDFDQHYYQCAPQDQQIPYLKGGEPITLVGLTPSGFTQFTLPTVKLPMQAILSNGDRHNLAPVIDTLILEPDQQRFTLVWRARIGLRRSVHEVDTLIIGEPTPGWERARMMDKLYLPLSELNAFKKRMQKQYEEEERLRELNADYDLATEVKA